MNTQSGKETKRCSFCSRKVDQVRTFIAGKQFSDGTIPYICNYCIERAAAINNEKHKHLKETRLLTIVERIGEVPTPREIFDNMSEYLIGQDKALTTLSLALHDHFLRIGDIMKNGSTIIKKNNIMVLGSTGVGKTLFAETIKRVFRLPLAIYDASAMTEAGYVGDDVTQPVIQLLNDVNWDKKLAEFGVVYLDEIGKKRGFNGNGRDVSGESVQGSLLKMIESRVLTLKRNVNGVSQTHTIDTSNILFIVGGVIEGVENVIKNRLHQGGIGFGSKVSGNGKLSYGEAIKDVTAQDIMKCGFTPEFVGRFPIIVPFSDLKKDELIRILIEPSESIINEYVQRFKINNIELLFDDDAIEAVAAKAVKDGTGARGLRKILQNTMEGLMFELFSNSEMYSQCIITREVIEDGGLPNFIPSFDLHPELDLDRITRD